jgi:hypothetical protein
VDQNSMAKDLLLYRGASSPDQYNSLVLAIIDRTSLRYRTDSNAPATAWWKQTVDATIGAQLFQQ